MTNQHGRAHEHDLVNGLTDVTDSSLVWVTSAGYSGNAANDNCDIVVTVGPSHTGHGKPVQYNIEAKKITSGDPGKRVSGAISGSSTDESGVDELDRLLDSTPMWADAKVTFKFSNRRLVVVDAGELSKALGLPDHDPSPIVEMLQPRLTPSDNISVVWPTLDDWHSTRASDRDAVVLARELNLPLLEKYK